VISFFLRVLGGMGSGASSSAASPVAIHKIPSSTSQGAPHPLKQSKSFFQRLNPQPSLPIDPMENPYLLRLLSSYCPHSVLKLLGSKTITEPISETITGACLLADICGFTKFSGDLCQEGVSGLDKLRITTSSFLTKFIEIIYFYYGDGQFSFLPPSSPILTHPSHSFPSDGICW
jgi:hypothetical protein